MSDSGKKPVVRPFDAVMKTVRSCADMINEIVRRGQL